MPVRSRSLRLLAVLALLSGLALSSGAICARSIDQREAVHVLTYDGTVDQVMVNYVGRGIDEAERTDARALVLRLDTPGGLVTSMEKIVKRINSSKVPIIVYGWPSGGHAASAGTFITMAGHVAAMAPSTRIGAASPVDSSGGNLNSTLKVKVTADLVALITGIARERGRNADWAERAVRRAVSANSQEAVDLHVVDFEARTLDSVLEQADGRTVHVGDANQAVTLRLVGAPVVYNDRTLVERFLAVLSDPNIAFLLLSAGALLLMFELLHPGVIAPGVVGVIALVLAFFSLGTLPVNWAGVALIALAFVLFAAEVFVTGFGALGIGGAVSLILGGLLLTSTSNPDFQVNRWLIFGLSGLIAAFFMVVVSALIRTRRMPAYMGEQTLVGRLAVARSRLDPDGLVFLEGGRWKAHAEGGHVEEGESVRITQVQGLKLTVRKEPASEQAQKGV
jgi:membrane-bound serine protease (ClpP class)